MTRRRLDVELVRRKLVESRTEARRAIDSGLVRVASNPQPKPSTLVSPDEPVHLVGAAEPFVSRGGRKLAAALDAYPIRIEGVRAVDVGASTGGFTDCLLQRGAESVCAVDVGYGQLHWRIRQDARVTVVERCNIRTAPVETFGEPFGLIVADLSFISLRTVAGQLVALGTSDANWVLLIKPQFEAGREAVGKGGIVRDDAVRRAAVLDVAERFGTMGLGLMGLIASPIRGSSGNVEYVGWFSREVPTATPEALYSNVKDPPA